MVFQSLASTAEETKVTPADVAKWEKGADQGDATAQILLGDFYHGGQGGSQDYEQAVVWYQKAADQGAKGAQASLGDFYEFGRGVSQDYVAAYQWYDLAAGNVHRFAAEFRDQIARTLTPEQLAEGQRRSSAFKAKPEVPLK